MWEPRPLTPLWAFTACYMDSFTFFTYVQFVYCTGWRELQFLAKKFVCLQSSIGVFAVSIFHFTMLGQLLWILMWGQYSWIDFYLIRWGKTHVTTEILTSLYVYVESCQGWVLGMTCFVTDACFVCCTDSKVHSVSIHLSPSMVPFPMTYEIQFIRCFREYVSAYCDRLFFFSVTIPQRALNSNWVQS
jgi:hypothetical protein